MSLGSYTQFLSSMVMLLWVPFLKQKPALCSSPCVLCVSCNVVPAGLSLSSQELFGWSFSVLLAWVMIWVVLLLSLSLTCFQLSKFGKVYFEKHDLFSDKRYFRELSGSFSANLSILSSGHNFSLACLDGKCCALCYLAGGPHPPFSPIPPFYD